MTSSDSSPLVADNTVYAAETYAEESVDLQQVAQILLRIVARLPKTEYSNSMSNGFVAPQTHKGKSGTTNLERRADERQLGDPPDPASVSSTSQG